MTIGMAAMRLLSIVLISAGLGLAQPTEAQGQKKNGDQQDAGANAQCARLPGGNAPVDRIARLSGQLSVNSLIFTYYGKPLAELTSSDFDEIEALTATCRGSAGDAMKEIRAFRSKVEEANAARGKTLDWIEKSQVEIGRMKGGPTDLERLQELWVEMLARSEEMLPTDRAPLARAIVLKQEAIYKSTDLPRQSPVWPPEPVTGQAPR
ncbi:hypothetical protein [Oceanibaculum indicum]|uniref:Uncharacterized protein n=1 Tax=Oceanibaculum indicum P24 TaxID=1207063 RepID=K2J3N9_9PROT|nr:hypothetical protein [Oceanibaculum indicum]EKE69507.1 hypothetical protein P24_16220 [Oceanibaculum indicum P24]